MFARILRFILPASVRMALIRFICRRQGHVDLCRMDIDPVAKMRHHVHTCIYCDHVSKDETTPLDENLERLISRLFPLANVEVAAPETQLLN